MKSTSFSLSVKEELTLNQHSLKERSKALLSAYIRINGSLIFHLKESHLLLKTTNAKIAKYIYEEMSNLYDIEGHFEYIKDNKFNNRTIYSLIIDKGSELLLKDLEIDFLEGKISKNVVYNDLTISGYLAGAFLASGSINSPQTSNYHLEISVNNENYAKWLSKLFLRLKNISFDPKIALRRDKYLVYLKRGDQIADFLSLIGASNSCIEYEDARVQRDFMNSTNRLENFDVANMEKVYKTGQKQIAEIKLIDKVLGIDNISNEKLKLLCKIRLNNESASLSELAALLSTEMNLNISKSNVNHLFRSLHKMYEKYHIKS